jgi:hypothetical protein
MVDPCVLEMKRPSFVVGDINGNFYALFQILALTSENREPVLFLGDYVGQGPNGVGVAT